MPLPYTYKNKIEVPGSEFFPIENAKRKIQSQLKNVVLAKEVTEKDGKINFLYTSLFGINYPVELIIHKKHIVEVEYEIKLMKLLQLSLALIVFIAFFSSFGMNGFLWFSAIFTIIFYSLNIVFIENNIKKTIRATAFYKNLNPGNEGLLSDEQLKWMQDKSKCPACGENLTEYYQNCPDCGLKLPQKAKPRPFDLSKYQNKRFQYHYKEKKIKK